MAARYNMGERCGTSRQVFFGWLWNTCMMGSWVWPGEEKVIN